MKLEDQVISFEMAHKLVHLGMRYTGLYHWNICDDCTKEYGDEKIELQDHPSHRTYPALTATELFHLLPPLITLPLQKPSLAFRLTIEKTYWIKDMKNHEIGEFYIARYLSDVVEAGQAVRPSLFESNAGDPKLAECLGKTMITLFDYGFLKKPME